MLVSFQLSLNSQAGYSFPRAYRDVPSWHPLRPDITSGDSNTESYHEDGLDDYTSKYSYPHCLPWPKHPTSCRLLFLRVKVSLFIPCPSYCHTCQCHDPGGSSCKFGCCQTASWLLFRCTLWKLWWWSSSEDSHSTRGVCLLRRRSPSRGGWLIKNDFHANRNFVQIYCLYLSISDKGDIGLLFGLCPNFFIRCPVQLLYWHKLQSTFLNSST